METMNFAESIHLVLSPQIHQKIQIVIRNFLSLQTNNSSSRLYTCEQIHERFLIRKQKDNGNAGYLFLITVFRKKYNIFFFRDHFYAVNLKFDDCLYKGTAFQGDLVTRGKKWVFYVNDLLLHENTPVTTNIPLFERLSLCTKILKTQFKYVPSMSPCMIQLTGYFLFHHIPLITKNCTLVFCDDLQKLHYHYFIASKQTKNGTKKHFYVRAGNIIDVYFLFENQDDAYPIDVLAITSNFDSLKAKELFKTPKYVQCVYQTYFNSWTLCHSSFFQEHCAH